MNHDTYKLMSFQCNYFVLFIKESRDRFYAEANSHIDAVTVLLLGLYNTTKNHEIYDGRFIYYLLSAIFSEEEKRQRATNKAKIAFAHKIFLHRITGAENAMERANKFKEHCKAQLQEIRKMAKKMSK